MCWYTCAYIEFVGRVTNGRTILIGNDVTHSTLLDSACVCSYKNLPKYRSYCVSNMAPSSADLCNLAPTSACCREAAIALCLFSSWIWCWWWWWLILCRKSRRCQLRHGWPPVCGSLRATSRNVCWTLRTSQPSWWPPHVGCSWVILRWVLSFATGLTMHVERLP